MNDRFLFWAQVRRPDKIRVIWSLVWRLIAISLSSILAYLIVVTFIGALVVQGEVDAAEIPPLLQLFLFCVFFVIIIGFGVVYIYWLFTAQLGAFHLALLRAQSSSQSAASDPINRKVVPSVVEGEAGPFRLRENGRWRIYGLALFSLFFFLASWLFLTLLLWPYVPVQTLWATNAGATLPFLTRVMVAASNWSVRLYFFLWPMVILVGAVVLAYLKARRMAHPTPVAFASLCGVVLGALALVAVVLSGVVVVCMHLAWVEVYKMLPPI